MATQAELRQRVLDRVYSAQHQARPAVQRLNGAVADQATDTTVTVDDGSGIAAGDIIEFEDGEQGLVWSVSTNDLTVVRAQNGTSTGAHSDNEFVRLNPIYTIKQADDALNEALREMDSQGLYQLAAGTDITLVSGTDLYELAETDEVGFLGVRAIFYQESSDSRLVGVPFKVITDPLSQELSGDLGVLLVSWGNNSAGDALSVIYAQSIVGQLGSITEPLIEDAAVEYAAGKILVGNEGPRLHDPGRHTDRTVQPGQHTRTGSFHLGQYQRMVWKAKARLRLKERNLPRHPKQRRAERFVG